MFNYKNYLVFFVLSSLFFLNSCSDIKSGLGFEKESPNEFLIEKRDSLVLPPDYKILPPGNKAQLKSKDTTSTINSILNKNLKENEIKEKTTNSTEATSSLEQEILKKIK